MPLFSKAAGVSIPGILSVIRLPGLNPSPRFMSVGSTGVRISIPPLSVMLAGIPGSQRLSLLPVFELLSVRVK